MKKRFAIAALSSLAALTSAACSSRVYSPPPHITSADAARPSATLLFDAGMADIADCQYAQGIAKLEEARAVSPSPAVTYNLGRAYAETRNYERAVFYLRAYLAESPGAQDRAPVERALATYQRRLDSHTTAPSSEPSRLTSCARSLFRQGMIDVAAHRYELGIAKLKLANDAVPAANVVFNVARAYEDSGDAANAIVYYEKYLAANPTDRATVEEKIAALKAKASASP